MEVASISTARSTGAQLSEPIDASSERKHEIVSLLEVQNEIQPSREPVPNPQSSQAPNHRFLDKCGWLFEAIGLFVAAAALIILIIVLRTHQNKPVPKWPVGLTLNTIVSIISTLFKSSLMVSVASSLSQSGWIWYTQQPKPLRDICWFDSASRGPVGSLQLIYGIRFSRTASIGAVLTITALVLGPIFQATISTEQRQTIDHDQVAQTVTAYDYNGQSRLLDTFSDSNEVIPYNMWAAIYSGILSSNTVTLPAPPFICPSGNCTWDPFGTLTVNAACSDISSEVALNCSRSSNDISNPNMTTCTFVSHKDTFLASMLNNTLSNIFLVMEGYLPRDSLSVLSPYANFTGPLATIQWVRAVDFLTAQGSNTITPDTRYEAGRCLFYLSVDQIQVQVTNGRYSEETTQTCVYGAPNSASGNYTFNGTDFAFRDPWDWSEDLVFNPPFAPGRNFSVAWEDFDGLASSLLVTLSDSVFMGAAEPMPMDTGLVNSGNINESISIGRGSPWALILLEADNATRTMENIAQYMTTALRSNDTQLLQTSTHNSSILAPDQIVRGAVWVPTQFVIVRWAFLALPAGMLVLAAVFQSTVIARTRQLRVGIWKSSPLTLLLQTQFGRSNEFGSLLEGENLDTASGMEDASKKIEAKVVGSPALGIELAPRN